MATRALTQSATKAQMVSEDINLDTDGHSCPHKRRQFAPREMNGTRICILEPMVSSDWLEKPILNNEAIKAVLFLDLKFKCPLL